MQHRRRERSPRRQSSSGRHAVAYVSNKDLEHRASDICIVIRSPSRTLCGLCQCTFGLDASADRATVIYRAIHREPPNITRTRSKRSDVSRTSPTRRPSHHVGRLAPQKGQRYLLAAMPAVLRHNQSRARLLDRGEGHSDPRLLEMIKALGIESSVHALLGALDVAALH